MRLRAHKSQYLQTLENPTSCVPLQTLVFTIVERTESSFM